MYRVCMSVCVRCLICVNIQVIVSEYEREHARKMVFQESTWRTLCVPLVKVAQSCLTFCDSMDCMARTLEPFPSPRDLPNPGIELSPALQADSLPAELQGKPKNTAMGKLSLLQGIFPTQACVEGSPYAS